MICALCQKEVGDAYVNTRLVLHEVTGWEFKRDQGGTNALRLRKSTGRVAHVECIDKERRGVNASQGSLL